MIRARLGLLVMISLFVFVTVPAHRGCIAFLSLPELAERCKNEKDSLGGAAIARWCGLRAQRLEQSAIAGAAVTPRTVQIAKAAEAYATAVCGWGEGVAAEGAACGREETTAAEEAAPNTATGAIVEPAARGLVVVAPAVRV